MSERELLERLHRARLTAASVDAEVAEARLRFAKDSADLLTRQATVRQEADEADEALRTAALIAFRETGDLKPLPGTGIRMVKKLDYDPGEAFDYARQHAPMYLALKIRDFESLARHSPTIVPFVEITEEAQVTIVGDLGPVLDGMKEEESHADT